MKKQLMFFLLCILYTNSFASVIVQNGLTHEHQLIGNQTITGKIILKNVGKKPERILIYQKDYSSSCSGEVLYEDAGTNDRSLANFLTYNMNDYTLKVGETYEVVYQIKVPPTNKITGSLWSLLMVEVTDPIAEQKEKGVVKIDSKIRYGIQIIATSSNAEPTNIKFRDVKVKSEAQGKLIQVTLENLGTTFVKPHIEVQLFNEKAELVKEYKSLKKKVYPSNCQFYTIDLEGIKKGNYRAVMVADYEENAVGININLKID